MPMMDAFIPEGALSAEAERQLLTDLTDILLVHEGADPTNEVARSIAWIFLNRPVAVYVAGAPAQAPHYRMVCAVPEGQFDPERRQAIVEAVTERVLDAEEGAHPRDASRVWVITSEVPDGTWGGNGRIVTLADIATLVTGDKELGRKHAEQRLASRAG
ncbi:tautomerase family protein [Kribbella sp. DT2]|uniref:tautomerase family protein n=1 Tax=Kribbella sp. DT2 TaxID=3393427 RepID=UPI003CF2FC66